MLQDTSKQNSGTCFATKLMRTAQAPKRGAVQGANAPRCRECDKAIHCQKRSQSDSWGDWSAAHPLPQEKKNPQPLVNQEVGEWRRRESNPNTSSPNSIAQQPLTKTEIPLSGNGQETGGTNWLDLSSIDADLRSVLATWEQLSDDSKNQILWLVQECRSEDNKE